MQTMSRRRLLAGAGAGAAAVVVSGLCGEADAFAAATGTTATTLPQTPEAAALGGGSFSLFSQADMNFETLFALGAAGQTSEVGEVIASVAQANAAAGGATYQSAHDAFVAMANRLATEAAKAEKAGHRVTARAKHLRAATYYARALYWVLGTSTPGAEADTYRVMNDEFTAGMRLTEPAPEQIEIPYRKRALPAWFLRPADDHKRRPTVIMNNGSDGQLVEMLSQGGLSALERGYNLLIFEGPGQGSMLFLHNVAFRPDWEKVITPIVDALEKRKDVNAKQIALRGISFGGELTPRAAAFDHRIGALIADPGSVSSYDDYPPFLQEIAKKGTPEQVNALWKETVVAGSTTEQAFTLKKSLEIFSPEAHAEARKGQIPTDWAALSKRIQEYTLFGVAEKIRTPTLVTQYQGDTFFKTEGKQLFDMLEVKKKRFVEFTAVNGAQYHCGPMAPQAVSETCWDWVDEVFDR